MRTLRYAYRMPMLAWHVLVHLPPVMLILSLPLARIHLSSGELLGHRVTRAWQGGLMRVFGFRLRRIGTPLEGGVMFVANHVSWVDILALHSQRMMGFVAKYEISRWPLVGWMAAKGETIFHRRGSQESLGDVTGEMQARLRAGRSVGVFPEGRTRGGQEVGPFHARIFSAAVDAGVTVQPVALRYGEGGSAQTVVAFGPGENFVSNFLRLLGEPGRLGDVIFLEPIDPVAAGSRRRVAELARERIVDALAGKHG